jgi:hypothetical protein
MLFDILDTIPGRKRQTTGGWYSFNAPCCHNRGHRPDKKSRGGLIITGEDAWSYHCFNCQFKCGSQPGKQFTLNTKKLLDWCGLDRLQVERLSFKNFSNKDLLDIEEEFRPIIIMFDERKLPDGAQPVDSDNPQHQIHCDYLAGRGLTPQHYTFYATPDSDSERERNRIIIPYYYNGKIVGHTSRFYTSPGPKYLSEQQRGYIFNIDAQQDGWQTCFLVEGQFDAISIGGCAYMSSTISDEQARLIKKLRRDIIVVPDRDSAGMTVCDRALELGYRVSIPEWGSEVKDVNDAVRTYGRLATTLSILEAATTSKITIEMKRKRFK